MTEVRHIRVVAAILDTHVLKLYQEDGKVHEIPQGDVRVRRILDAHKDDLAQRKVVTVDLADTGEMNEYAEFEKQTSGIVKLFRVAKKFVKHIFNPETDAPAVEPIAVGNFDAQAAEVTLVDALVDNTTGVIAPLVQDATPNQKPDLNTAVDQIMANAVPASSPNFRKDLPPLPERKTNAVDDEGDTMIAVVDGKVIPGVESLKGQFANAANLGSTVGVTNFLRRIATVIDRRRHSVEDLLRFMEKGDLPIADDGSIVAYKVLQTAPGVSVTDKFVDCHTRLVTQRVGSFVVMDEKMVDPNRRNECSNGLHIARRGYLGSFSGDIIVICKIAPEDVIAVPSYDSNKVRVCGYHILGKIPSSEHSKLRQNQPMTGNTEAGRLLAEVLRGNHIGKIEEVRITGQRGQGVKITPLVQSGTKEAEAPRIKREGPVAHAIPDDATKMAPPVDVKQVSKEVVEQKQAAQAPLAEVRDAKDGGYTTSPAPAPKEPTPKEPTRAEKIAALLDTAKGANPENKKVDAARELIAIAKKAKKGLDKLGVSTADVITITKLADNGQGGTPVTAKPAKAPKPIKPTGTSKHATKGTTAAERKEATKAKGVSPAAAEVQATHSNSSAQKRAFADLADKALKGDRKAYQDLIAKKRAAKKSWNALGISNFDAIQSKFEK